MSLSVLICDNSPVVSDGLGSLLSAEPDIDVIGAASDERQAMVMIRSRRPEVVLTGLRLGGSDSAAFLRRLHDDDVNPAVVVLATATGVDDLIDDALRAGATGVLAAESSREELLMAVRAVGRGQAMLGPSVAWRLVEWFRSHDSDVGAASTPTNEHLTKREREVLKLTARGLSVDEIADQLYIGVATVRTHIYRIRHKLRLRDRAQLVTFAHRTGLMRESA